MQSWQLQHRPLQMQVESPPSPNTHTDTHTLVLSQSQSLNTHLPPIPRTLCLFPLLLVWVIFRIITSASSSFQAAVRGSDHRQAGGQTDSRPNRLDGQVAWALGWPNSDSQSRGVQSVRQSFSLSLRCLNRFTETLTRC